MHFDDSNQVGSHYTFSQSPGGPMPPIRTNASHPILSNPQGNMVGDGQSVCIGNKPNMGTVPKNHSLIPLREIPTVGESKKTGNLDQYLIKRA